MPGARHASNQRDVARLPVRSLQTGSTRGRAALPWHTEPTENIDMVQLYLGPNQDLPSTLLCMVCRETHQRLADLVALEWLHDRHGRVLWFVLVCQRCYGRLPARLQALAPAPPYSKPTRYEEHTTAWYRSIQVDEPDEARRQRQQAEHELNRSAVARARGRSQAR